MLSDYSNSFDDCAVFLPAISEIYAQQVFSKPFQRQMPLEASQLNFLDPNSALFFYPWALYSAGQAARTDRAARRTDNIVSQRNRQRTTVVGDSGGYQIATNVIDWEGTASVLRSLRWMEDTADFAMAFDFPTDAIGEGHIRQHRERLVGEGIDLNSHNAGNRFGLDYNACLQQTLLNNKLFAQNRRPGKAKVLNVIQGRNERESRYWYEAVKAFDFSGWSFADENAKNLAVTLRRLINMRDDNLLNRAEWLHFLGVGELDFGVLYTTIKQSIFASTGHMLGVSYDASSSFLSAARGTVFTGYILDESGWRLAQSNITQEGKDFREGCLNDFCANRAHWRFKRVLNDYGMRAVQGTNAFPGASSIGEVVAVHGKESSIMVDEKWDTAGYLVAMNHNTHLLVDAHRMAQRVFSNGISSQIPNSLRVAIAVIREVFQSETPFSLIDQCERELDFAWR